MKVIFLDIDGTLYSSKANEIPSSSIVAIAKARANGHKVLLCTGRSMGEATEHLGFEVDGFIFSAGNVVYVEKQRIYKNVMDLKDTEDIMKFCIEHQIGYTIAGDAGAYCDNKGLKEIGHYFGLNSKSEEERNKELAKKGYFPMSEYSLDDKISKMGLFAKSFEMGEEIRKNIPERYSCKYTHIDQDNDMYSLEVIDKAISKATGIEKVLEYYNVDKKDAIACGDSSNDVEMLQYCGIGVAMGNGSDDCKAAADYVTDDILEYGIYNAFKKFGVI
ncbi:MAG: Cof-type HAD-IIB family hydrolase [Erysipelotrichaceae bacterium]